MKEELDLDEIDGPWVYCENCTKKGTGPLPECKDNPKHELRCGYYESKYE